MLHGSLIHPKSKNGRNIQYTSKNGETRLIIRLFEDWQLPIGQCAETCRAVGSIDEKLEARNISGTRTL